MERISVLIPTLNEERNLPACLESVSWAHEVFVFDSYSRDQTCKLAEEFGARLFQRHFDNFSTHKNWALDNLPISGDWILIVDADERVTEPLRQEIEQAVLSGGQMAWYVPRKNLFMGRWIRHGGWYPDYQLRLFRRGTARYEDRIVHEHMLVDGPTGYLENPLIHHDFKGLERYFDRHNTYSSLEAVEAFISRSGRPSEGRIKKGLFKTGPQQRRALKEIAYRVVPSRPLAKFAWMYLFKLGFLDGKAGFTYCALHAFYEYQISLKLGELQDPASPMREKYRMYLEQ